MTDLYTDHIPRRGASALDLVKSCTDRFGQYRPGHENGYNDDVF